MARIILFPVPAAEAYPRLTTDLAPAESVLLLSARWWMESWRERQDPLPRLQLGLERAGARRAAGLIDRVMTILAHGRPRPIETHLPRHPQLHDDEARLLHAAALSQAREDALAERALRTTLLSAHGAELAMPFLLETAALFAAARLLFPRRAGIGTRRAAQLH